MDKHPGDDYKDRRKSKLLDGYALDTSSGLYKPKSYSEANYRTDKNEGRSRKSPFHINVVRDWPILGITFLISILTLFGLAATVYFTSRQWNIASRQLDMMTDTFHESQMQSDAMELASEATKNAADTSSLTMRLDQRAWIVVRYPPIPLTIGHPITVPLTMENTGKTMAKNIRAVIAIYLTKRGATPNFVYAHGYYSIGPTGFFPQNTPATEKWVALTRKTSEPVSAGVKIPI